YLRRTQSEQLVKQALSEQLGLDAQTIDRLIVTWLHSPTDATQPAIADFLAPEFADSDPGVEITAAAFPAQFATITLLHRIATVPGRLSLTTTQLRWIFEYGPATRWYDLRALPLASAGSTSAQFAAFVRLIDLARLRDSLPLGETVLDQVFAMARHPATTQDNLLGYISEQTGWAVDSLTFLASPQGLDLTFPSAFADERGLARPRACFAAIRPLGAAAA